ncbi:MAG TPA: hypothetical protein VMC85_17695, partial [Desulfomonilaceae bacterium]|nr:hypothetical protein [Desulfomonilaceae bacterium]
PAEFSLTAGRTVRYAQKQHKRDVFINMRMEPPGVLLRVRENTTQTGFWGKPTRSGKTAA